jgi:UTP-glucose-1-phosphate uridylyltransferase
MKNPDTAIIPCGGLGTRMRPMTRWIPKELLPVGLTPLIHWTLAEAAEAGLTRAIVVTNPAKPILGDVVLDFRSRSELQVVVVSQDRPAGLGDALLRARSLLAGDPFAVVLPDNLFRGPNQTAAVLAAWRRHAAASVLIADVTAGDAATKGATGRARVRGEADGSLRVVDIADKGVGRFDT